MNKKEKLEKKVKRRNIQNLILNTIATTGIISIGLLAPNVLVGMNKLGLIPHKRQGESIKNARNKLIKDGLIKFNNGKIHITEKGKEFIYKENAYLS